MAKNTASHKQICSQWSDAACMHPWGSRFSFLLGEAGGWCWNFVVPMVFPWCSQYVPQHVPKIAPCSLYPIYFVLSSTLVVAQNEEITTYLFCDCPKVEFYLFFFAFFGGWWGQSKMPITKENKLNLQGPPQLINMSHNIYCHAKTVLFKIDCQTSSHKERATIVHETKQWEPPTHVRQDYLQSRHTRQERRTTWLHGVQRLVSKPKFQTCQLSLLTSLKS
jgi:hypothetical protein